MRTTTPVRTGYGQALARTTTPQQQQQQQQRQAPSGGPSRARSWRWGAPPHVAFLVALAVIVVVYTGAMWATAARAGRAVSGEDREKQQAAHHLQGTAAGPGGPSDHSAARDGRRRTTTARAVLDAWDVRMRDQGGGGPSKATPPASSRPTAGEGGASEDDERRDPGVHDPDVGRSLPPLPHGSRVFVTGAAGFIALHVIEALVALPAVDAVVGMDCYSDYYSRALKEARVARLAARGVRVLNASVCDQELVSTTLRDHGITHVVHLAAQPGIEKSLTHPRMYVRNNVECFVSLLEAVRAQAAPPAVVFASSSSVYGTVPPPFREDQPIRPANVYGATKAHTEMLAHVYHSLYGLRAVGLRFFTVYGPFMRPDMAVYHFSSLIDKGGTVVLKGAGLARDFTHVGDAVQGVTRALRYLSQPSVGAPEMFNIASGETHAVEWVVHELAALLKKNATVERIANNKHEMVTTRASLAKAGALLGYAPQTNMTAGLRGFVTWFGAHRDPSWDFMHPHDK